ncbi:MAG: alpha-amylase family glycosyl hydrolase [Paludibacter sp.]|nr:alpha-amylase family glycosyl hydrolase [Paludibacter sp.]
MKKTILFSLTVIFAAFFVVSCNKTAKKTFEPKPVVHSDWTRSAVIYEVNVRQYTKEGTFKAFEKYLPQLKDLGVDVLWFMPVNPISELNRKGKLGSYYAVKDYKAINPEFGTADDFKTLVASAHEQGFKVIIDWVANHTGCDNVWLAEHKDWYMLDSVGNPLSPYDWTDTYKLNYGNGAMRAAMTDAMKFWVSNFDIDGFRCDVAGEVPTSFWDSTRIVLDSIKPVFMLAEAENPELLFNAFDADYAWNLLHLMNNVAKDSSVQTIRNYLIKNDSILPEDAYKMNFITNHDENSWNGTEYERYKGGVQAFAVLTYTLPGMPLIYSGQEIGFNRRLKFFDKDQISWSKNSTFAFYKKLNNLKHTHPALKAGAQGGDVKMFNRVGAAEDILIFSRKKEGKEIVVALNLSGKKHDVYTNDVFPKEEFTEYFTGKKSTITFPIKLGPWEYKVWVR